MKDYQIETSILVNNRPIREYEDKKSSAFPSVWVEAREGSSYGIRIKNNTYLRKLAVISVDGINVITGEPAEHDSKNGYIINPYSPITIEGWRISDLKVKEFIFTFNKNKSYSVKLGHGEENLGVIGILLWDEIYTYPYTYIPIFYNDDSYIPVDIPVYTISNSGCSYSSNSNISYNSENSNINFQAGTQKGKEKNSNVSEGNFYSSSVFSQYTYYYDSWNNLKARGIVPEKTCKLPQAFKPSKYCPDI